MRNDDICYLANESARFSLCNNQTLLVVSADGKENPGM